MYEPAAQKLADSKPSLQLLIEEPATRHIGLEPLAVDHNLGDGTFAHVPKDFVRGDGVDIDIDLGVGDPMGIEELLGCPAIATPRSRIDPYIHNPILTFRAATIGYKMTAEEIKALLKLEPHPIEGGWFRRTYTSGATIDLPRGVRAQVTAIYYLLEPGTFSEMHVLDSDEIFHFYLGDPVEMLQLHPSGSSAVLTLGSDLQAGQQVQVVVPAGVWQGTRLIGEGKAALMACTVTPGFNYADYHNGKFADLAAKWPDHAERIRALTRS